MIVRVPDGHPDAPALQERAVVTELAGNSTDSGRGKVLANGNRSTVLTELQSKGARASRPERDPHRNRVYVETQMKQTLGNLCFCRRDREAQRSPEPENYLQP
jgi:hypothetical protein